jgi:single-stranded DNA-binding protein
LTACSSAGMEPSMTTQSGNRSAERTSRRLLASRFLTDLSKGRLVYIDGRLHTREWEGDDKVWRRPTEVIAEEVKFLNSHWKNQPKEQ